jgi:uncharacterized damage-inducible protein DinB
MGCHRSGTNFLYDTLLSAGGFAVYRGYLPVHKLLIPRFGPLDHPRSRKRIVDTWMRSKGFPRSGLDARQLSARLLSECRTGGEFIRIVMDQVAEKQGVDRWAVYDPDNVLHVMRIKADMPDALFVHIIRDGRDVAFSLMKMGGFRPFPWNPKQQGLLDTALYWEWMVQKGQYFGRQIPDDYTEVHYEQLVTEPRSTLAALGQFLHHDLDYDRIQNTALGRLRESNSSFRDQGHGTQTNPVNRWKEKLSQQEIAALEALVGPTLEETGYALTTPAEHRRLSLRSKWLAFAYPRFLDSKLWLKQNTPVGRFVNLSVLELSEPEPDTR